MFHAPDYYNNISMRLSDVLDDIGVNEKMVMIRRRVSLLEETTGTITGRATGQHNNFYILGSRNEGTTTIGLHSDYDMVFCAKDITVIQDWSQWTPCGNNFLTIQHESTPPGYCLLQTLRLDAPLPDTAEEGNHFVKDTSGRILFKNTLLDDHIPVDCQRQGPSFETPKRPGFASGDFVVAFPCTSWQPLTRMWLEQQETNTWPTPEMERYMKTTKCFVVPVGCKASENADFEWRHSTSLAERCLMFNLNITQIRCYILMKMIIKTYINLDDENNISSYMCKTVLFHCTASKHSTIWKKDNILNCLTFCLSTLQRCILSGNCPHFINENNLMARKISAEVKHKLLERMANLIPCDTIALFGIQIDNLGERFQIKLNMVNEVYQPDVYTMHVTSHLLHQFALHISAALEEVICKTKYGSLEMKFKTLLKIVLYLTRYYREGNMLEKTACRLQAPLLCTSIGSLIASYNIQINNTVSPQAFAWVEAGLNSDVASSRLKLASVMYCTGDMERAALVLNDVEEQYDIEVTEPLCVCYSLQRPSLKQGFCQRSSQCDAEAIKYIVAFCVRFFPDEINCVPHELRYEMFRATHEDLLCRDMYYWMDCAMVDSLPYLYFLQYKTYCNLQRPEEQRQALNKLVWVIEKEHNLGHRETALNLLGQCMEQESRPADALKCYAVSICHREKNNAAKIHICRCLANTISNRLTN